MVTPAFATLIFCFARAEVEAGTSIDYGDVLFETFRNEHDLIEQQIALSEAFSLGLVSWSGDHWLGLTDKGHQIALKVRESGLLERILAQRGSAPEPCT